MSVHADGEAVVVVQIEMVRFRYGGGRLSARIGVGFFQLIFVPFWFVGVFCHVVAIQH